MEIKSYKKDSGLTDAVKTPSGFERKEVVASSTTDDSGTSR